KTYSRPTYTSAADSSARISSPTRRMESVRISHESCTPSLARFLPHRFLRRCICGFGPLLQQRSDVAQKWPGDHELREAQSGCRLIARRRSHRVDLQAGKAPHLPLQLPHRFQRDDAVDMDDVDRATPIGARNVGEHE